MANTITPILPQDIRREYGPRILHWDQVYFGPDASKYDDQATLERFVVSVKDIIMHPTTGDWVVTFVSDEYIPTLIPRKVNTDDSDVNDSIVVPSKSYNRRADVLSVDITSTPIRFYVNSRIWINGSQGSHFKIFRGTQIDSSGVSIGAVYNANGKIVDDSIELELVAFDRDVTNMAIRTPKTGHLRELPVSDDLVTLVVYAQDGTYLDSQVLVVSHENYIPSESSTRFISDIRLDTPYLSESDDTVIEVKRNMLLQSLGLFAVATYNDGTESQRLPVGGSKFKLNGIDAFTASTDLQEIDVVLSYVLGKDEAASNTTGTAVRHKTKAYTIRTMPSDAAYSVKLFAIPIWNSVTAKWTIRYKLYDLRRDTTTDVTDLVELSDTYKFNPDLFGQKQTIQVAINLKNVGPQYEHYRPVQMFYITLIRPGATRNVPAYYLFSYSSASQFGDNLAANYSVQAGKGVIDISCGHTNQEDWIAGIYKNLDVIYTGDTPAPPTPTSFRFRKHGDTSFTEIPMTNITKPINVNGAWNQGDTIIVEFFAESAGETLELAAMSFNVNLLS